MIALGAIDIRNRTVVIRADDLDEEQPFKLWIVKVPVERLWKSITEGPPVAACKSPDTLGRWALDAGVQICRHEYDMIKHFASIHSVL